MLEKLNQPNFMWITFADGEAVTAIHSLAEVAKNQNFDEERRILLQLDEKEPIEFKRAAHPSDFKFENREIKPEDRMCRLRTAKCFLVIFALAFGLSGTMLLKGMQIIGFMYQPPMANCEAMHEKYDHH